MNSKQRRVARRKWLREHREETEKVIAWINSPEKFVPLPDIPAPDNVIEMGVERIKAFGATFLMEKEYWKDFLIEKGIFPERFVAPLVKKNFLSLLKSF